jgi:hypothetical protein
MGMWHVDCHDAVVVINALCLGDRCLESDQRNRLSLLRNSSVLLARTVPTHIPYLNEHNGYHIFIRRYSASVADTASLQKELGTNVKVNTYVAYAIMATKQLIHFRVNQRGSRSTHIFFLVDV